MNGSRTRDASPFVDFDRPSWARLGESTPLPLTAGELDAVRSLGDAVDLDEVRELVIDAWRMCVPKKVAALID
jgi:type I pantothenate kinase